MITIYDWMSIDNLSFSLYNTFNYIREEAELLGQIEEFEIVFFVENKLEDDFPALFKDLRVHDVVSVEQYMFEPEEEDVYPGYAVYIYFKEELIEKMVKHILKNHSEYVLFQFCFNS